MSDLSGYIAFVVDISSCHLVIFVVDKMAYRVVYFLYSDTSKKDLGNC